MKQKEIDNKKDLNHQIYQFIVLIMMFMFIALIIGFIFISVKNIKKPIKNERGQIFDDFSTKEEIYASNFKYYNLLKLIDKQNFALNNSSSVINDCDLNNFYKIHIYEQKPCLIRFESKNNSDDYISYIKDIRENLTINNNKYKLFDYLDYFLVFKSYKLIDRNIVEEQKYLKPKLDNYSRIFINLSKKLEKILISPISQIENFNLDKTFKKRDNELFKIKLTDDLDKKNNNIIIYEANLKEGDLLYVPSFYFIQQKEIIEKALLYKYRDDSILHNLIFQALYNY